MKVFLKDKEYYKRDIRPIEHYVEQAAFYLHKKTGDSLETCKEFVKDTILNGPKPMKRPRILYFERNQETLDREKKVTDLYSYITSTVKRGDILAPTFTTYIHPSADQSLISNFAENNAKNRSIFKKKASKEKAEGNIDSYDIFNNKQATMKTYNNSLSGTFATDSSVFYNPSAHSTLTSITRTLSSFGNVYNEKVITGNRHYRNYDIVINNIISITYKTDKDKINKIVNKYNLKYPTAEDALDCVKYSSRLSFNDKIKEDKIYSLLLTLSKEELADFVYCNDLYHIRKHNDGLMREFIGKLSKKVEYKKFEDPLSEIYKFHESVVNLTHHICSDTIRSINMYDYKDKLNEDQLHMVASVCDNVNNTLNEYADFIECFLLTNNIPASHAYIKEMPRRTVVLSDTDSTCSSYQEWVEWYFGACLFTEEAIAVSASIMLISTSVVTHALALFSANLNTAKDKLNVLAMKNEYAWRVMTPLNVRKHYFADTIIKEGLVFKESELERKGVHLINSNIPLKIRDKVKSLMLEIDSVVTNGNKLSINELLNGVIDIELDIIKSVSEGKDEYFRKMNIQEPKAYKNEPHLSPYIHYLFWEETLEKFYGVVTPPPFRVIKVPTTITSSNKFTEWLNTINNSAIKISIENWMDKYKKDKITTLYIPLEYVQQKGIPDIFINIIDTKRMVLDICNSLYLILESLGYFKRPGSMLHEEIKRS